MKSIEKSGCQEVKIVGAELYTTCHE